MIKHVVMWTFQKTESNSKEENIEQATQLLNSMKNKIQEIESLEVGRNINSKPIAYDLVLITTHKDTDSLKGYQEHPEHIKVAEFIGKIKDKYAVVDFEY